MQYLTHLTSTRLSAFVLSMCRGLALALGLVWVTAAWATPLLYVCPGPLFTNNLVPAQAKALGCELATQGRWSQAQGQPEQALANHEPGSALAATPMTAAAGAPPGTVFAPVSPAPQTATPPSSAASTAPTSAPPAPVTAAVASPLGAAATRGPANSTARRPTELVADASRQRQRDSHAREIVLAELTRTLARIQTLSAQPPSGPEAESALLRLRIDEDALRRELARRPG